MAVSGEPGGSHSRLARQAHHLAHPAHQPAHPAHQQLKALHMTASMDESLLLHGADGVRAAPAAERLDAQYLASGRGSDMSQSYHAGQPSAGFHGYAYATNSPLRLCNSQELHVTSQQPHVTSHQQQAHSHSSKESGYSSNRPSYHENQSYHSQQELLTSQRPHGAGGGGGSHIPAPHPGQCLQ